MYSFRDIDTDENEDFEEELKKAYHEGMKDGIKYARKGGEIAFRHDDDSPYYSEKRYGGYGERSRDSYGRYR